MFRINKIDFDSLEVYYDKRDGFGNFEMIQARMGRYTVYLKKFNFACKKLCRNLILKELGLSVILTLPYFFHCYGITTLPGDEENPQSFLVMKREKNGITLRKFMSEFLVKANLGERFEIIKQICGILKNLNMKLKIIHCNVNFDSIYVIVKEELEKIGKSELKITHFEYSIDLEKKKPQISLPKYHPDSYLYLDKQVIQKKE